MIFQEGCSASEFIKIVNHKGEKLTGIKSFNTETGEAEIYPRLSDGSPVARWVDPDNRSLLNGGSREVITVKCDLIGCKAIDIRTRG